jgi:hypothetical protein
LAAQIAAFKLNIKCPTIRFFEQSAHGYIQRPEAIDGYSPSSKEIFLRKGMPLTRIVEIAAHETRHCWQWAQARWANRTDAHCEADAKVFTLECFGTRRLEDDFEKLILILAEIGAPLAIAAGDELTSSFCIEELRIAGHPAAAKFEKQFAERQESRRKNITVKQLPDTADDVRDYYYTVMLPVHAERFTEQFIKPHLRVFEGIYPR